MIQDAAVLVPVYRRPDGDLGIVLVRRSREGSHGGQIAFPGGKPSPGDDSLQATALREAHEETGLFPAHVTILAELPSVETHTTRYRIYPFLAGISVPNEWRRQKREIAEIIDLAVLDLAEPSATGEMFIRPRSMEAPRQVPCYRIGHHRIWGATFRILEPLIPRLLSGEWAV
jgi:8-oxo-dGTP pyrophosphatase MutT (NUDIX family)